ncbi:MAG: hypothetical protein Q9190_001558 [Brigantiaea leucoxantha]
MSSLAKSAPSNLDDVMPLLFAAHPDFVPKYKIMTALDEKHRSESSFEHRFRKWRQEGRKLVEANGGPETVAAMGVKAGKADKTKAAGGGGNSAKRKAADDCAASHDDDKDLQNSEPKSKDVKIEQAELAINGGDHSKSTQGKQPRKRTKKESTDQDMGATNAKGVNVKKGPVAKKGTARAVKKGKVKSRGGDDGDLVEMEFEEET